MYGVLQNTINKWLHIDIHTSPRNNYWHDKPKKDNPEQVICVISSSIATDDVSGSTGCHKIDIRMESIMCKVPYI